MSLWSRSSPGFVKPIRISQVFFGLWTTLTARYVGSSSRLLQGMIYSFSVLDHAWARCWWRSHSTLGFFINCEQLPFGCIVLWFTSAFYSDAYRSPGILIRFDCNILEIAAFVMTEACSACLRWSLGPALAEQCVTRSDVAEQFRILWGHAGSWWFPQFDHLGLTSWLSLMAAWRLLKDPATPLVQHVIPQDNTVHQSHCNRPQFALSLMMKRCHRECTKARTPQDARRSATDRGCSTEQNYSYHFPT